MNEDFITVAAIKTPLPMDVFGNVLAAIADAFPGAILAADTEAPIDPTASWTAIQIPRTGPDVKTTKAEVLKVALALREYIDAIPKDVQLPEMPGMDRDWVDETLEAAKS